MWAAQQNSTRPKKTASTTHSIFLSLSCLYSCDGNVNAAGITGLGWRYRRARAGRGQQCSGLLRVLRQRPREQEREKEPVLRLITSHLVCLARCTGFRIHMCGKRHVACKQETCIERIPRRNYYRVFVKDTCRFAPATRSMIERNDKSFTLDR